MKNLMRILGALFLSMTILFSCSDKGKDDKKSKKKREISLENVGKNIESEEDAVEDMMTLGEARLDLLEWMRDELQRRMKMEEEE